MDLLLRTSVFFWISAGFLPLPEMSEACPGNDFPALCDLVFRNVCFEFVEESKSWFQARSSCEKRGGDLLEVMNSPTKGFLNNITRERNNFTWWLGEGVQGESAMKNGDVSESNCTYMKLTPLELFVTSDCNQRRGFLCIYYLQSSTNTKNTIGPSHASRSRLKRSVDAMRLSTANITLLLEEADKELLRMEMTPGEPTNDNRDKFIEYLFKGTKQLTKPFAKKDDHIVSHIIHCSTAILLLSMKKCDIKTNPNHKSLFEEVFKIFRTIAMLLGSGTEDLIIKHQTGNIYQSSRKPADLDNAVLGSEKDGEFIKLPSFSALQGQLGDASTIIAQMTTFSRNPHPSSNISGTVCSLLLNNGLSDIKLTNLTEMIEIFLPRPNASALINHTVALEKDTKAVNMINISDPDMTIIFSAVPNVNVSLILTLSHGSPPSPTFSNATAILSPTGDYRWMITPEMLAQTPGIWYVDTRLYNSTWEPGLTLSINSFVSKCLYWDIERELWSIDGCQVGEKSTPERTQCLCDHLTLFGSSFFVMPNYVDISRTGELFSTVSQNYVVLALLCAFFGLYLITLIWACYADRRSRSKVSHKTGLFVCVFHIKCVVSSQNAV
ncbi:polycystic kidney disease protein 1-like 2 isoform X1 [Seriola aureovittata]|uniref:polycystic kidney disease protein 1-like 2 isoform X1 n=1 Tax=Seriola aureovittata TaxID=2871759 RepID=UPI0024BD9019|nr:polycystic kidney disease protein 1-like 2 isoform X1 [Seriola aureovittata]